jgi:hypothetical protein
MRLTEIFAAWLRWLADRLTTKAETKPKLRPEWDISSPEEKGNPVLGRAFIERWNRR